MSLDVDPVLPPTARRLLTLVAEAQADGRAPSVVAGVVRDGALVWSGGWGDVPGPVTDTQYRIGSITKTLTAVTVLQAVRDGLVALDDPVGSVLTELGTTPPSYGDRTLRQLLSHSSGMQSEPAGEWWERTPGVPFAELVAAHDGSGAVFPAGQQHHYTNLAFALLGESVARLRGVTWWETVRSGVVEPLGLARTTYLPEGVAAQGWSVDPYARTLVAEPATDTRAMAPAGQVWSTVADLATYAGFLVDGHPDVLDVDWLDLASHPVGATRHSRMGAAHGLGLALLRGGSGLLRGHTGSMPGFQAACFADAPRRTAAVVLANATTGVPTSALATRLLETLHDAEPTLPTPWRPSTDLPAVVADVLGVWHWGNTPSVWTWEDAVVVVRVREAEMYRFAVREVEGTPALVGVRGYHDGETVHVVRREDGSVSHLEAATFVYSRAPYEPGTPVPGGHPA